MPGEDTDDRGSGTRPDTGGQWLLKVRTPAEQAEIAAKWRARAAAKNAEDENRRKEALGQLSSAERSIGVWLAVQLTQPDVVQGKAELVRMAANEVVVHPSGQDPGRFQLERDLDALTAGLDADLASIPSTMPTTDAPQDLIGFADEQIRQSGSSSTSTVVAARRTWEQGLPDAHSEELTAAADRLQRLISDGFERYKAARSRAVHAVQIAHAVADEAMRRSRITFRPPTGLRPARVARAAAAAPLAVFLAAAVFGILARPTTAYLPSVAIVLVLTAVVAGVVAWRHRVTGANAAAFGAGAALAVFTAAYLLCIWADAGSIVFADGQLGEVAEAALVSLTVSVTAGTIGVNLLGAARIVAFVQILLTVAAVGAVARWAWHRVIDRPDVPPSAREVG